MHSATHEPACPTFDDHRERLLEEAGDSYAAEHARERAYHDFIEELRAPAAGEHWTAFAHESEPLTGIEQYQAEDR